MSHRQINPKYFILSWGQDGPWIVVDYSTNKQEISARFKDEAKLSPNLILVEANILKEVRHGETLA